MRGSTVLAFLASTAPRIIFSCAYIVLRKQAVHSAPLPGSGILTQGSHPIFTWHTSKNSHKHSCEMNSTTYDLAVIGGGPGGLAAAKEASRLGSKTVLFDHVQPSPRGSTWGLGGTCVNVGCIPKKLMHYAALLGHSEHDRVELGWAPSPATHSWEKLVETVQNYVKMLNFSYRSGLMTTKVEYLNARAKVVGRNSIEFTGKNGTQQITAKHILIAVGERPTIPKSVPGAADYAITSDDIFMLKKPVGKTLIVGASFVALECAGFLTALGYDTTVAVRSILLRGFDRQCSEKVGELMVATGTKFIYNETPASVTKLPDGRLEITFTNGSTDVFDTLVYATGRLPDSTYEELRALGVEFSKAGRINAIDGVTSVDSIYAVGDIVEGNPALAPVAVKDGELLARRIFGKSDKKIDLTTVPMCVYTPFEFGTVGLSEEAAKERYGEIEVYLSEFTTLELSAVHRVKAKIAQADEDDIYMPPTCLAKLVCRMDGTVVGAHFVGPNAGEIIQGIAVAIRLGAKKQDFDDTIGIHPTDAESFMGLFVTKSSGESWVASGGCGGGRCG